MKVTRADWAGSVPWAGIIGKPTGLDSGAADLSQLTARVAALEALLSSTASSPSPVSTLVVEWDIDTLASLQAGYEDITIAGLPAGSACVLVPQDPYTYLIASAAAVAPSTVRLTALNVGPLALTPGMTIWTLFVIHG